jgi:hypothetical protein
MHRGGMHICDFSREISQKYFSVNHFQENISNKKHSTLKQTIEE